MKLNYETCVVGSKVVLVPYRPEHVVHYHQWMTDPDLLHATGSEPLSLKEEYEMQKSWRDDEEKCTFIVLTRERIDPASIPDDDEKAPTDDFVSTSLQAMVGDVNLFISKQEQDDPEEVEASESQEGRSQPSDSHWQAEIDIMIAEKGHQGKGLGKEASLLMMLYGAIHLDVRRFFCKINEDNNASIALFQKLDFEQCSSAECFRQVELELRTEDMTRKLETLLGSTGLRCFHCSASSSSQDKDIK